MHLSSPQFHQLLNRVHAHISTEKREIELNYDWELELKEGDEINLRLDIADTLYTSSKYRLYFSGQLISLTK